MRAGRVALVAAAALLLAVQCLGATHLHAEFYDKLTAVAQVPTMRRCPPAAAAAAAAACPLPGHCLTEGCVPLACRRTLPWLSRSLPSRTTRHTWATQQSTAGAVPHSRCARCGAVGASCIVVHRTHLLMTSCKQHSWLD